MPRTTRSDPVLARIVAPSEPERAAFLAREWLETDGLGGYASSTLALCPTRRYHGLLVGRPAPGARRHVFLARFEERVTRGGLELAALSAAAYGETHAPEGWRALESFELAPFPRAAYRVEGARVTREILLVRGARQVLVRYRVQGALAGAVLALRPLLAMREADALTFENDALDPAVVLLEDGFSCRPYAALPALSITCSAPGARFVQDPVWYRGITYALDAARGYPAREDQFSPGVLELPLEGEVVVAATVDAPPSRPLAAWRKEAKRRRAEAAALLAARTPLRARLELAARDFLYRADGGRHGVDAGYPWFGEWGRDAFVALPGLTLSRGDLEGCAAVLSGALEHLQDGLLPNVFGVDRRTSAYASADAALWFARAVRLWEEAGGPEERLFDEYLPALREIAEHHHDGTGLGIRADDQSLLHVGGEGLNPTWMDACAGGAPVTPRDGFPVEINALWYALLSYLEELFEHTGDKPARRLWGARRRSAERAFLARFWLPQGYLADVWKDGRADPSVRPNMAIAAALEASPLGPRERAGVVARCERDLLVPEGLRTLAPASAAYAGRYEGGPEERDRAYHQGTVWPWLFGFWAEAKLRAGGARKAVLAELARRLEAFAPLLDQGCLNHVAEVFDGDAPRRGGGTCAQAWNTAELLRLADTLERGRP